MTREAYAEESIVVLGDSTIDNGSYVGRNGLSVGQHLAALNPGQFADWSRDGARIADICGQLGAATSGAVVVSVGGNDALACMDMLTAKVHGADAAIRLFWASVVPFARAYDAMLAHISKRADRVVVCTIYEGAFPPPLCELVPTAVALFNDSIYRAANRHGAKVIDLRDVVEAPGDFYNPIEPNDRGGRKIAEAIVRAVRS